MIGLYETYLPGIIDREGSVSEEELSRLVEQQLEIRPGVFLQELIEQRVIWPEPVAPLFSINGALYDALYQILMDDLREQVKEYVWIKHG